MNNNLEVNNKLNIADKFFMWWSFFIPITTIILIPSIKMSVLSSIFAYISPFLIMYKFKYIREKYIIDISKLTFIFVIFLLISQLSNIIFNININYIGIKEYSNLNGGLVFKYLLFNQTLYLIPGILTFFFAKYFYNRNWDKWIIYSSIFFSIYALYKWIYFLFTGEDGDFLTNKVYDSYDKDDIGSSGYLFQIIAIGGVVMQRVQGLSGEPSMYAFTILPYFIFAIQKRVNKIYIFIIGISMILSMSTTVYIGMVLYFIILFLYGKIKKKYLILFILLNVIVYIIFKYFIDDILTLMIFDKLLYTENSISGSDRSFSFISNFKYWSEFNFVNMLFGIGYGYVRSLDFITSLLVNTGILGLILFSYFILKNIKWKNCSWNDVNNNAIILCLYTCLMIAVPEIWFPSFWLFIGIIRNQRMKK